MLFNSYEFIFFYLPVVFVVFFSISKISHQLAALWLAIASLVFYGYWNPNFVLLLLASIVFNYAIAYGIGHAEQPAKSKMLLIVGIVFDLALLAVFKYSNFFISSLNSIVALDIPLTNIVLPLGISFFTFTQIAFLVDVHRGIAREYNFIHYLLFVTYFPHLIAGPVLHHKQMMPQFALTATYQVHAHNIYIGLLIFVIGLAKKVLLADSFAEYASPVFDAAKAGSELSFFVSWIGALAYTLQLYFDFSGYSDMAIGISKLFGVELPINFNSPYKAKNIIDFWRRWHMTLSQFLRDYLYFALGGNRRGEVRRYLNLIITMVLGGLWHGASWTFVVWGFLHGGYLLINHAWMHLKLKWFGESSRENVLSHFFAQSLTFLAVVIAWVFFRAETFSAALNILNAMSSLSSIRSVSSDSLSSVELMFAGIMVPADTWTYCVLLFGIGFLMVFCWPNTQAIRQMAEKHSDKRYAFIGGLSFLMILMLAINASRGASEFIYFNF